MRVTLMHGSVIAAIALLGPAAGGIEAEVARHNSYPLIEKLRPSSVIEQYVAEIVGTLRNADRAGDGLDRDDVKLARELQLAQMRANNISQVMRNDLDGDFRVTRSELERSLRVVGSDLGRQVDNQLAEYDTDGDNVITLTEAASINREPHNSGQLEEMFALDPNRDGALTSQELHVLAEQQFNSVDSNNDGKISDEEYGAIADRVREVQVARSAPVCPLPPLPIQAKLVAFGAYEGDSISSVAVGGPDKETNLIDVVIEPGSLPLYLVLTSYESMVWRLSGATHRVARVVVSSYPNAPRKTLRPAAAEQARIPFRMAGGIGRPSASGVVGIPAKRVTIAGSGCPQYFSSSDQRAQKAVSATLRRALGREPDTVVGTYSVQRVSLPSGQLTKAERRTAPVPPGFDKEVWTDAALFWPGGLVRIDPERVVAATKVAPYDVLPSQMGLAQLAGSGALQRLTNQKFRIVRPIAHMPPSMGGSHSVTLILAKGVPMPPGDPVHSCIVSEETGRAQGATCPNR